MRAKRSTALGPRPYKKPQARPATTALPNTNLAIDREADVVIHFFKSEGDVIVSHKKLGMVVNRPVSYDALADLFGGGGFASGLLPPNIIATGRKNGIAFFVSYIPPQQKVCMHVQRTEREQFIVPTPPLILAGWDTDYRIFAIARKQKPTNEHTQLALPPYPNTYETGGICWGSAWSEPGERLPPASAASLPHVLKRLLSESMFTHSGARSRSKSYPDDLYGLWAKLGRDKTTVYPIDDLRNSRYSLRDLTRGSIWEK